MGTVEQIIENGVYSKIFVDTGVIFVAAITRQSVEFLTFKATAVHVYKK